MAKAKKTEEAAPKAAKTPKAAPPAAKPNTAPKSKPMSLDGKSVHSDEPVREPHWSPRRVALIKAMRALGAVNNGTAVTATEVAKKMGTVDGMKMIDRVDIVKIHLDVYRTSELVHNKFAASTKHEGERELRYYLTAKGQKTTFPVKEKKAAE